MIMTVSIEQAQLQLAELIEKSSKGEEVVITREGEIVAQLVPRVSKRRPPRFGFAKDLIQIVAEDDEHLKDFEEYM